MQTLMDVAADAATPSNAPNAPPPAAQYALDVLRNMAFQAKIDPLFTAFFRLIPGFTEF